MSILIKGMEMPKDCGKCFVGDRTICSSACPLVPVPPHGRLIDADALDGIMVEQSAEEYNHHHAPRTWERALSCFRDYILAAPTIIEAEEATQKDGGPDESPAGLYDLLYEEGGYNSNGV